MTSLKLPCAAVVLTCVFTLSVFAGDMSAPIAPPSEQPTVAGDMHAGVASDGEMHAGIVGQMSAPLTQAAAFLMQGLLPLF
jgi:hypothetical protein